jgi:hypothetical protein
MRGLLGLGLLIVIAGGCQQAPPAPHGTSQSVVVVGSRTTQLVAEGDALAGQQDWAGAALKYQTALNDAPGDTAIRFALASALTHLDRRDEAIEHFTTVVRRGKPGSPEVRMARDWLIAAQVSTDAVASTPAPNAASSASEMAATMSKETGRVSGKLAYQSISPYERRVLIAMTLTGEDNGTREIKRRRPDFKLGRGYEFNNLPPGAYSLVAEAGGVRMWEQRVSVEANKATVVDLTDDNSVAPANFTPPAE